MTRPRIDPANQELLVSMEDLAVLQKELRIAVMLLFNDNRGTQALRLVETVEPILLVSLRSTEDERRALQEKG